MFFVHTSLVLFMSLERLSLRRRYAQFYVRRIFRIYPLAVATVAVVLWTGWPPAPWLGAFRPTHMDIAANFFLIQNLTGSRDMLATMWSLPFEVQMYAVLPVLFAIRHRIHSLLVWGAAMALASAVFAVDPRLGEVIRYAPCFCAGLVAYWLIRARLANTLTFRILPLLLSLTLILFVTAGHFLGFSLMGDAVAALAVGLITGSVRGDVPPWIARAAELIAKYSYGIYLAHLPLLMFCFGGVRSSTKVLLFPVLMVGVPVLIYHLLEEPMIRAGGYVARRIAGPDIVA